MEEEDYDFSRPFPIFCDFLRLNLQPFQALKAKSNPKQTHPKCICDSSSITQQKFAYISSQTSTLRNKSSTSLCSKFLTFNSSSHCVAPKKQSYYLNQPRKKLIARILQSVTKQPNSGNRKDKLVIVQVQPHHYLF